MGLVHYYEDGDGNGNGNGNCLRGKRVGQGGERGNGRMGLFLFFFIFDIVQSGQQKQRQQRYVLYFQRQFWDTNHLMYQCIMYQFLCRLRYLYEYILNSYFQSLAASFFDIRSQGVSKVSCTNSYVDQGICMTIPQTDSMFFWQHHFWHMNIVCCHWYHIPIPMQNHKFVCPYFKQLVCVAGSIIFGI